MTRPIDIPTPWVDFLESGVGIFVATVDAARRPESVRAAGTIVGPDRTRVTVLVPAIAGAATRANLEAGSAVALTYCRPFDYRTIQLKGRCVAVRDARDDERPIVQAYHAGFVESLYTIGVARSVVRRFNVWPAFAAEVELDAIFDQTPGPRAGEPLGELAAR